MLCPPEIHQVVLEILETGILRIRAVAWSGQEARCAIEADHLHNLPALLANYSDEMLRFYWEVERPSYRDRLSADQLATWEPIWEKLRPHVEALGASATARPVTIRP